MQTPQECVPLVEITRSGVVEERHRGSLVIIQDDRIVWSLGDPQIQTPMRSTAKPFQLLPLLVKGGAVAYGLTKAEIAVMASSHNGEKSHVRTIRGILDKSNLDESLLKCGTHPAYFEWITEERLRETGEAGTSIHNNCSGKHTSMLLLSQLLGSPYEGYWLPSHPVQVAILETMAALLEREGDALSLGVDGCGVPTFNVSLLELARLYFRLAIAYREEDEPLGIIARAMSEEGFMVGGTDRLETDLMRFGHFIGKVGSQGIFCISVPSERMGIAVKIESGSENVAETVAVELLAQLALLSQEESAALERYRHRLVQTWTGVAVGSYAPVFSLKRSPTGN